MNQLSGAQFTDARFTGANAETLTGDYKDEATIDAALTTANGTYFTAARLATMGLNDKVFALRSVTADKAGFLDPTPPRAKFTYVATLLSVAFTNASTDPDGGAMTYSWNYGDGSAPNTTTSPTKVYGSAGTYTVTLTTTNALGRKATSSQTITVVAAAALAAPAAKGKNK
jgi:PKD repeat protein